MRYWLILIFNVLIFNVSAQSGGEHAFAFLSLTNSANVAGIGGANVSLYGSNAELAYHNPALLSPEAHNRITLNYVNYFAGINFGYAGYTHDLGASGTVAAGIHYVNYGTFIAANDIGTITGEFKASDYALNLFWAKQVWENWNLGINLKPIYSHLETYQSFALAADAGLSYAKAETGFSAGFVLKNVGYQFKSYYDTRESLPFDIQAGVSKRLAHAPFRVHFTAHHLTKWNLLYEIPSEASEFVFSDTAEDTVSRIDVVSILDNAFRHAIIAVEIIPAKSFFISLGYNHLRRQELRVADRGGAAGFTFGFGLNLNKFGFTFARQTYHLVGGTSHFSLNFKLNHSKNTQSKEKISL